MFHNTALQTVAPLVPAFAPMQPAKLDKVAPYGFAPDMEHGLCDIGAIYEDMDMVALEETVLVSFTALGQGASMMTLGRWREGFLDLVQLVERPGVGARDVSEVFALLEGAQHLVGVAASDTVRLQAWLVAQGASEEASRLGQCVGLPLSRNREDLLRREWEVLGLAREDLATGGEIQTMFAGLLRGEELMGLLRLQESGRADMLTASALFHQRARSCV